MSYLLTEQQRDALLEHTYQVEIVCKALTVKEIADWDECALEIYIRMLSNAIMPANGDLMEELTGLQQSGKPVLASVGES